MKKGSAEDPKGLIEEAYRIDGISEAECRSIFLDWALSLPSELDTRTALKTLVDRHSTRDAAHPMTGVLRAGLGTMSAPRRRGGWRSRLRN